MKSMTEKEQTISHLLLAELSGKRQDNVKRTIDMLVKQGFVTFTKQEEEINKGNNRIYKITTYNVDERDSYIIMARLCPEYIVKLVDFWLEHRFHCTPPKIEQDEPLPVLEEASTMTSLEIAEITGKRHDHVLRDIDNVIKSKLNNFNPSLSSYVTANQNGKKLRMYILNQHEANIMLSRYKYKLKCHGEREHAALCTIEQLLHIKLIRQYRVGKYRIDGYHKESNTAYEIDEDGHNSVNAKINDIDRQRYIEKELGCKFVRINVSR